MNLLNFLESAKKHEGVCDYLRAEIAKMEIPASSRTQPIDRVIDKHVKKFDFKEAMPFNFGFTDEYEISFM